MSPDPDFDDRGLAGVDLLRRTGALDFQIRFSDDLQPVVWVALASWRRPVGTVWASGSGFDPTAAVMALCEKSVDGGKCQHCGRPTAFLKSHDSTFNGSLRTIVCTYQWDPELKTFRRSCEGETP